MNLEVTVNRFPFFLKIESAKFYMAISSKPVGFVSKNFTFNQLRIFHQ